MALPIPDYRYASERPSASRVLLPSENNHSGLLVTACCFYLALALAILRVSHPTIYMSAVALVRI